MSFASLSVQRFQTILQGKHPVIAVAMALDPRTKGLDHMPTEGAKVLMWQQLTVELQKVRAVRDVLGCDHCRSFVRCCCTTIALPLSHTEHPQSVSQAAELLTPDTGSAGAARTSASAQPAAMRAALDALGGSSLGPIPQDTYLQRIKAMVMAENNLFHRLVDAITAAGTEKAHLLEVRNLVALIV